MEVVWLEQGKKLVPLVKQRSVDEFWECLVCFCDFWNTLRGAPGIEAHNAFALYDLTIVLSTLRMVAR